MKTKIRIATKNECSMIKSFDDLCFGSHHGVSKEEIMKVIENGVIFLLFDENDNLVGESQLVLNQFGGCHDFPAECAYAYGTAIHPDHQGMGYGKILSQEQEEFSRKNGKKVLHFTVRLENYASLKMRVAGGAVIIGYDRFYYGTNFPEDSRLILEKNLEEQENNDSNSKKDWKFVEINFTNKPDLEKHKAVESLINQGFKGYNVKNDGIMFAK